MTLAMTLAMILAIIPVMTLAMTLVMTLEMIMVMIPTMSLTMILEMNLVKLASTALGRTWMMVVANAHHRIDMGLMCLAMLWDIHPGTRSLGRMPRRRAIIQWHLQHVHNPCLTLSLQH
jgi:hypothetical protein